MTTWKSNTEYYTKENGQDPCRCGQWRQFYGHAPEYKGKKVGMDWENLIGHEFQPK